MFEYMRSASQREAYEQKRAIRLSAREALDQRIRRIREVNPELSASAIASLVGRSKNRVTAALRGR